MIRVSHGVGFVAVCVCARGCTLPKVAVGDVGIAIHARCEVGTLQEGLSIG